MAADTCCHCLRWFVFILNFLFWVSCFTFAPNKNTVHLQCANYCISSFQLAGMGVLGVALWLLFDADFARVIGAKSGLNDFYIGVYILIAVGVVMTVLGFLGCCGALRKSQILLTAVNLINYAFFLPFFSTVCLFLFYISVFHSTASGFHCRINLRYFNVLLSRKRKVFYKLSDMEKLFNWMLVDF